MSALLRPALVLFAALTLVTGIGYPLLITVAARLCFPAQAEGSLIRRDGRVIGSALLGQPFDDARYFWGRPSATGRVPCDASASAGSNLGPLNPLLEAAIRERAARMRAADPTQDAPVPVDLITASASGLDPHISPAAARYQAGRVARQRGLAAAVVEALVERHVERRAFGIFGEPRVNVLQLNLALDELANGGG